MNDEERIDITIQVISDELQEMLLQKFGGMKLVRFASSVRTVPVVSTFEVEAAILQKLKELERKLGLQDEEGY